MTKRLIALIVPLLLLAAFTATTFLPWASAQGPGKICIAQTTDLTCPASPVTFTGPVTAHPSQLRVVVFMQDSPDVLGFDVTLTADSSILRPADADLTGTLSIGTITILGKCIGGVPAAGGCGAGAAGDPNTLEMAVIGSVRAPTPVTGLLFTAVYDIVGSNPAGTPIVIGYKDGCSTTTSSSGTLCVGISDGTATPVPETVQTGAFDDSTAPPSVAVSASPTSIGPIFPGDLSTVTTVTATSSGFDSTTVCNALVTMTQSVAGPAALTASLGSGFVDLSGGASGTTMVTVSATSAVTPGSYTVTVTGTYQVQTDVPGCTGVVSTISQSVTIPVTVVDYSVAAVAPVSFTSGSPGSATVTISSVNGFAGSVSIVLLSISPSTGLTQTIGSPAAVPAGGSATVTLTFASSSPATYTVTDRASSTLSSFARTKTVSISVTVNPPITFDFSLGTPSPASLTVVQGGTSPSSSIIATLVSGTTTPVTFSTSTLPTGVTAAFTNNGCSPTCTVQLAFSATATATTGTTTVTISATGGGATHTTTISLTVSAPSDFSISAGAVTPSPQISAGSPGTSTITVTALNGFTGTVTLTDTVPVGLTCTLPASVTFGASPQTATLSCSATTAGDYTVTVTGTSGSLTHTTANIVFHVVDFTISFGAVSPGQILAGASGTSTITVTALNGFTGTVTLSDSVPAGLTCTLPASVVFGTSPQTATLSCTATVAGDYTVTVTGTNPDPLSHPTANIVFHVVDFTIEPGVTSSQILAGDSGTSAITVSALNGLTGTVTLSVSASTPAGLTCTLASSVTFGTSPQKPDLSCSATTAGDYSVTVTGTDGSLSHSTSAILFHVVDFTIDPSSPVSLNGNTGDSLTQTITVTGLNGFAGDVALSVSASTPAGLTCTLPASVTFGASPQTATLSCLSRGDGSFVVTVTGTSGTLSHTTADITFGFTTPVTPDFTVSAGPVSPSQIFSGESGTSTITVTSLNHFISAVSLTASASTPAGLTCSLSPSSVTPPDDSSTTSTLTCSATTAGDYTVIVTGTSGSLTHDTSSILFHVVDFTISAGAVTPSQILAGGSGTSTITVTALNGLTGTVGLSISASSPAGLTCLTLPAVHFGTSPQTATLSCSASVAGDYTVTVTGLIGTLSHTTADILFHVTDFSIAPSSPVTVNGDTGSATPETITVTAVNGFTGTVSFTVSASSPAGLTCPSPASVTFGGSPMTTTLSCTATVDGDYVVTVSGTSGTLSHSTASITFHMTTPITPEFNISAGPVTPSQILAGDSGTSTITLNSLNGFTQTVNLSVSASTPSGLTCTIAASISLATSPQTTDLSCSATAAGDYTVTVTGTSAPLSHQTGSILFHVTDFTIAPSSPVTVSTLVGLPGSQTITLTALNGFTGTVALTDAVPAGATCNLPVSVTFGNSPQQVTLFCSANVAGDYTVTVTGDSGTLSHTTADITFRVTDFSISPSSPVTVTGSSGNAITQTISVAAVNGFTGTVDLSVSASTPSGLTCTLPASVTLGTSPQTATLSCSATVSVDTDFTVTVTGMSSISSLSHDTAVITFHVTAPAQDFTISAGTVAPSQILAGSSGTSTITLTPQNGFTDTINLSASASTPAGLTCSLTPTSVTFGTTPQTSDLSCSATAAGDYTVTVTGTGTSATHQTASILFHVTDFSISPGPVSPSSISSGSSGTSAITVTALNGFTGTVNLSVSTSTPSGLTCTLPASVTLGTSPQTATLSCTAVVSAATDFTISVTGSSSSLSHTTADLSFHFVPQAEFDFRLSASPTSGTVAQGGTTSTTIAATLLSGTGQDVTFSTSGLPSGVTASFAPSNCTPTCLSIVTFAASSSATGSANVTITGMATGGLQRSTFFGLRVLQANVTGDFSINVNPDHANITAGSSRSVTVVVHSLNNFAGKVSLSVTITPSLTNGLTGVLSKTSVTLSANGTQIVKLLLGTVGSTPTGTYHVVVTGSSGSLSHSDSADVTVKSGKAGFSINAKHKSLSLPAGSRGNLKLVVQSNRFAGNLFFTASVVPVVHEGPSASPAHSSLVLSKGGSAPITVRVSTGSDTPPGTYVILVFARGHGQIGFFVGSLTVTPQSHVADDD